MQAVVRAYQLMLSPVLPPSCRFLPTCSDYAIEALAEHGPLRGSALAVRRLARCHPWGGQRLRSGPTAPIHRDGAGPSAILAHRNEIGRSRLKWNSATC